MHILIKKKGAKSVSKKPWTIRTVIGEDITYLTQGAAQYCGLEIELNLPIKQQQAVNFLRAVVSYCQYLEKPVIPDIKNKEIFGVPVMFKKMLSLADTEKVVYRLIFPDDKGLFPDDRKCHPTFKRQFVINSKKLS